MGTTRTRQRMRTVGALSIACIPLVTGFSISPARRPQKVLSRLQDSNGANTEQIHNDAVMDADAALIEASEKFTIQTCSATSCAAKRKSLGMDEFATYSAFYGRIQESPYFSAVQLEESSCLGSCKLGPCVGIEHDEYDGPVALEGMNPEEFSKRTFHSVITEGDADRVWESVENAIRAMREEEQDASDDDYDEFRIGVEV